MLMHLFAGLEDLGNSAVRQMIDSRKTNFMAKCQKERDLIHEECVCRRQKHLLMKLKQFLRDLDAVPRNSDRLASGLSSLELWDVLSLDGDSNVDILDSCTTLEVLCVFRIIE